MSETQRIVNITIDERTVVRRSPQIEHELRQAVFDLLEENEFQPVGNFCGPYCLHLSVADGRLQIEVHDEADQPLVCFRIGMSGLRAIVKDYFLICESYFDAIKNASPAKIEAIDMGRRGVHNEGAELLLHSLEGKAHIDKQTARRLFTLICVMHIGGRP